MQLLIPAGVGWAWHVSKHACTEGSTHNGPTQLADRPAGSKLLRSGCQLDGVELYQAVLQMKDSLCTATAAGMMRCNR